MEGPKLATVAVNTVWLVVDGRGEVGFNKYFSDLKKYVQNGKTFSSKNLCRLI